jgi:hypothetical protein
MAQYVLFRAGNSFRTMPTLPSDLTRAVRIRMKGREANLRGASARP